MSWTDEEKGDFGDALLLSGELMGKEVSTAAVIMFVRIMEGEMSFREAKKALDMHLRTPEREGTFFPKPADLIRIIKGTGADHAQLAWSKVESAVRHVGTYKSVVFDDAIIHRVLADMGGWPMLGQKTEDELPFVANEFRARYHALKSRGMDGVVYPPSMPGYAELTSGNYDQHWYAERGLSAPTPVMIGDPQKAQRVITGGSTTPAIEFSRVGDVMGGVEIKKIGQAA